MSNTEHVQTGFAAVNGTTLYYEVAGTGHPFVLAHGHLLDRDRGTISSPSSLNAIRSFATISEALGIQGWLQKVSLILLVRISTN